MSGKRSRTSEAARDADRCAPRAKIGRPSAALTRAARRAGSSLVRACALAVFALGLVALAGCHSAFVLATIDNQSGSDLKLLEVDYPSASFGVETLAARDKYHYRFKVQGSGPVKIQFADNSGKLVTSTGPQLEEGQEGKLEITIDASRQVKWSPTLHAAR